VVFESQGAQSLCDPLKPKNMCRRLWTQSAPVNSSQKLQLLMVNVICAAHADGNGRWIKSAFLICRWIGRVSVDLKLFKTTLMTPSQLGFKQNPDKSDWLSAIVEVLDLSLLSSQSIGALLATSRQLHKYVHDNITSLKLQNRVDVDLLVRQQWPMLAKLALHQTGWPMAAAVAQGSWHALQELDFSSSYLELLDMQHLAECMLPQLTRLKLKFCGAGPGMCRALVNGHWPHLAVLNLCGNSLGPADVQDLA